ncbi:MAG: DUF4442 domain-containing protein [Chitinophagales bacterium]
MDIEIFRSNNAIEAAKYRKLVMNRWLFELFLLKSLPMGFLAGLRVKHFDAQQCEISVPFRWLNQNPFRSTYFAVLAMAAEMSSGMIAMMHTHKSKPSVSMLVTRLESEFIKKATGITTFTCADGDGIREIIERCIITGEGQTYTCTAVGRSESGEEEARFRVTWSFKARKERRDER